MPCGVGAAGSWKPLRGPVALADHAAEHLRSRTAHGRCDGRLAMIGWPLVPGLVWPVAAMPGIVAHRHPQVAWLQASIRSVHSARAVCTLLGSITRSAWRGLGSLSALGSSPNDLLGGFAGQTGQGR